MILYLLFFCLVWNLIYPSIQWTSRSIWIPPSDCSSEKQQVHHKAVDAKKITVHCFLDFKLCDQQYPFQLITAYFDFLWAVGKIVFPHREGCGTERKITKRKAACPHSQVQPSAAEGEGSCHREQMEPAWVMGTPLQWDRQKQAKSEKRKPEGNLKGTWREPEEMRRLLK